MMRKDWSLESNRPCFESQLCKPTGCPTLSLLLNSPTLDFIFCEMTIKKKKYLFIWLIWALVAARGLRCPLPCGILVPSPGIEPKFPALEDGSLIRGSPENSFFFFSHLFLLVGG